MNPNGAIIVQSNLEIMVEVDAPSYEAARDAIAPFTELVKSPEHLHTYKISHLSLWNAAATGLRAPDVIERLESQSRYPIPQTVITEVEDYMARYGLLRLKKDEIVPFIEKNFRAIAKPASRAIAGLSMGGGHTITASNLYPEMFDYICPLSAAGSATPEQVATLKKAGVKLYFLACGNTDFLFEGSKTLDKTLTEQGLDHEFFVSEGGHVWANWRLYLNTFAQKLFK